ncbi:glycoside hydrolase family 6 protein [Agromyces sp. LHK192]|uniref:glycoside hydrolase family 6 protein n=1 Tax=Agromyces sp. LHK192 TaxID=2498704 RepID=UPI001F0C8C3B|nr:glycoside hydrolase family 6 protein [Agromyces sp. LHK192]
MSDGRSGERAGHHRDDDRYLVVRADSPDPRGGTPPDAEGAASGAPSTSSSAQAAPAPHDRRSRRRRRRAAWIAAGTIAAVGLVVGAVAVVRLLTADDDPFAARAEIWTDADSSAARAAVEGASAAERDAAEVLAARPTAIWLTPERDPVDDIGSRLDGIIDAAASADAVPVVVVYGITDRDCGGASAGGLPPAEYEDWIDEIARTLRPPAAVVLEPDALALAPECDDPDARIDQVADALDALGRSGAAIYLDGGHSAWLPPDRMADLLRRAGVDHARGFATNVSNTQSTDAELEYASALSTALGGSHAVIDVSRNGAGPPADGEWCNAPDRAIGTDPRPIDDPVVDALLWVKPPGESDGPCNGGPAAGTWWPDAAIELVRNAEGSPAGDR